MNTEARIRGHRVQVARARLAFSKAERQIARHGWSWVTVASGYGNEKDYELEINRRAGYRGERVSMEALVEALVTRYPVFRKRTAIDILRSTLETAASGISGRVGSSIPFTSRFNGQVMFIEYMASGRGSVSYEEYTIAQAPRRFISG